MVTVKASDVGLDLSKLPGSDEEASRRADTWKQSDPFTDVEPALLNSADLFDYISTTGMIHPFEFRGDDLTKWLKPASCGIRLGGDWARWDYETDGNERKPQQICGDLKDGDKLTLPKNSIVYATLKPTFRLPDYIGARFNLSIRYVYRGLLVGTGPLVDPGFQGRLAIPLHNLTAHECLISAHDVVLWMEFTKLSANERWGGTRKEKVGRFIPFPKAKLERGSVVDFLDTVRGGEPIMSSIPDELASARHAAERSAGEAEKVRKEAKFVQVATILAVLFGVIGIAGFIYSLSQGVSADADRAVDRAQEVDTKLDDVRAELFRLRESSR